MGDGAYNNLIHDLIHEDVPFGSRRNRRYDHSEAHFGDDEDLHKSDEFTAPAGIKTAVTSLPVDHAGTTVYLKSWQPEDSARYPLLIIHDLGEQTDFYRGCAFDFVKAGYSVYVFDLRGHGRSGRRLGHAPSFNILVKDLLQVAAWVRHRENGHAPVILGHGIGALIMLDFAQTYAAFCKAIILSAPCLELQAKVTLLTRLLIKFLAEVSPNVRLPAALTPRFARTLKGELKDDQGSSRRAYFPQLSAIFAHELLLAIERADSRPLDYPGSMLILCPEQDTICSYARLKSSVHEHAQASCQLIDLAGVGHHLLTEDEAERRVALDVILPWLDQAVRDASVD